MLMPRSADPKSVHVNLTTGTGMDIEWQDGHRSHYSFSLLRAVCPCAACATVRQAEGRQAGEPRPLRLEDLGTLGAPARPTQLEPVGKYALRFLWEDGHREGAYSWEFLRDVCPCAECAGRRPTTPESR